MNNFWPEDVSVDDTSSPYDILESAREEWEAETEGEMTLELQQGESKNGHKMVIVHAKHVPSNRTATLLEIVHRQSEPYPVTIQPREEELPDILKRERYQPGLREIGVPADLSPLEGRKIKNEWVSDTPSEFREKLSKALHLSAVKTAILGLACEASDAAPEDEEDEPQDDIAAE